MKSTIELDCAPATPRPDSYISGVLEGTGLKVEDFELVSKVFGNWTWELREESKEEAYAFAKELIKDRIVALYNRGCIRYGSW